MVELSSLDVHFLTKELQTFLNGKVEKIVQSEKNKKDVLFTMYVKDMPKVFLRFYLPGLICTPAKKPQTYPQVPPGFAMFLRKYVQGTRLTKIEQKGFDRIITFTFERKDHKVAVVVELMKPGNMLVLIDGIIKQPLENQRFKDRSLLGRKEYEAPPPAFNILEASEQALTERLEQSEKDTIVTKLALDLGLGGVYAEEVCHRAGVEKKAQQGDNKKLIAALHELLKEQANPCVDEKRAYPINMQSKEPEQYEGTFVQALAQFVDDTEVVEDVTKKTKKKEKKLEKIQEKRIAELEKIEKESREKAEKIYEEYAFVQELLETVQNARKTKQDPKELLKKYKNVKFIPKTGELEVEF
ncbi:MAG: NFACT family protein [Candidatus Woesearchaeota archaeon]|nr:NFACT family protein [Candidatus Woesearchaeota archaeon]